MDPALASEEYGYLTTTGRTSGKPREIEIWFGLDGDTIYLMAGGRESSHWVRNVMAEPRVTMRIAGRTIAGRARVLEPDTPEDTRARHLLMAKYEPSYEGDLSGWGRTALPVGIRVAGTR